tara:strand:- start:2958 stop:3158 length:201 start_codon:yes stop_codon:yes gene_type:complete
MMKARHKYNHAFTVAFSIETDCTCEGDDYPTDDVFAEAIRIRIVDLIANKEMQEAIGAPFDSYEND